MSQTVQIDKDDPTFEDEDWNIQLVPVDQSKTVNKGRASYSPVPNYMPQDANATITSSANMPQFAEYGLAFITSTTAIRQMDYISNVPRSSSIWFTTTGNQSLPLTEEELHDIGIAIKEVESGKAKRFKNLRDAFEWLDSESD